MDTETTAYARIFEPAAFLDDEAWHAAARELRRNHPLLRVESEGWPPVWAVTRYDDIMEIERRPDVWLNTRRVFWQPVAQLAAQKSSGTDMRMMIQMDDPDHKVYRNITADWFRPATLRRTMYERLQELAKVFVDRMAATNGTCDFAADVAKLYPLHVIMSILGVPESDERRMLTLTQELLGPTDDEQKRDADDDQGIVQTLLDFITYFQDLSQQRRAHPTEDVASTIANATVDGHPLADLEAMSYYVILATAGHDTTSSALAGGMEALIRHADALRRLQAEPELIPNAVDEMIRWTSPVKQFLRTSTEDYELHGQRIPAGDHVLLSFPSGNYDETVFEDPFSFDVARPNADRHLAFGFGKHFCLGAQLARMELRAFFSELLPRLERIEISGDCQRVEANIVSGFKHLPVTFSMT